MSYRQRLYDTYVSNNKQFLSDSVPQSRGQDLRNIINLRHAMKSWLQQVPKNAKCLDVACGPGNILSLLQVEGLTQLYGVDISLQQVEIARQKFPEVVCSDAIEYLAQHQNEFLLITAFDILEHFNKDEAIKFLDAIHNALLPEGRLILQLPNGDSPFAGAVVYGDMTHEVTYTTNSLRHLLLTCGFSDLQFQEHRPQRISVKGMVRSLLWDVMRQIIKFIHLTETGGTSTGIYTRVMRATAVRST